MDRLFENKRKKNTYLCYKNGALRLLRERTQEEKKKRRNESTGNRCHVWDPSRRPIVPPYSEWMDGHAGVGKKKDA